MTQPTGSMKGFAVVTKKELKAFSELRGNTLLVYLCILKSGCPTGTREIQKKLDFSSPGLATYHLDKLENLGLIEKTAGGYVLVEKVEVGVLSQVVKFGSLLLMGFMSKNYDYICLKPYERGVVFEQYVKKELEERKIEILRQNYVTPEGEIDFIGSKNYKLFFIEAKDYGPWFDDHYISSRTYEERMQKINNKVNNSSARFDWVDNNREQLELPRHAKMKGIILTRFNEPHINTPTNFECISIADLNKKFGKSKSERHYFRKFKFTKSQIALINKKTISTIQTKKFNKFELK